MKYGLAIKELLQKEHPNGLLYDKPLARINFHGNDEFTRVVDDTVYKVAWVDQYFRRNPPPVTLADWTFAVNDQNDETFCDNTFKKFCESATDKRTYIEAFGDELPDLIELLRDWVYTDLVGKCRIREWTNRDAPPEEQTYPMRANSSAGLPYKGLNCPLKANYAANFPDMREQIEKNHEYVPILFNFIKREPVKFSKYLAKDFRGVQCFPADFEEFLKTIFYDFSERSKNPDPDDRRGPRWSSYGWNMHGGNFNTFHHKLHSFAYRYTDDASKFDSRHRDFMFKFFLYFFEEILLDPRDKKNPRWLFFKKYLRESLNVSYVVDENGKVWFKLSGLPSGMPFTTALNIFFHVVYKIVVWLRMGYTKSEIKAFLVKLYGDDSGWGQHRQLDMQVYKKHMADLGVVIKEMAEYSKPFDNTGFAFLGKVAHLTKHGLYFAGCANPGKMYANLLYSTKSNDATKTHFWEATLSLLGEFCMEGKNFDYIEAMRFAFLHDVLGGVEPDLTKVSQTFALQAQKGDDDEVLTPDQIMAALPRQACRDELISNFIGMRIHGVRQHAINMCIPPLHFNDEVLEGYVPQPTPTFADSVTALNNWDNPIMARIGQTWADGEPMHVDRGPWDRQVADEFQSQWDEEQVVPHSIEEVWSSSDSSFPEPVFPYEEIRADHGIARQSFMLGVGTSRYIYRSAQSIGNWFTIVFVMLLLLLVLSIGHAEMLPKQTKLKSQKNVPVKLRVPQATSLVKAGVKHVAKLAKQHVKSPPPAWMEATKALVTAVHKLQKQGAESKTKEWWEHGIDMILHGSNVMPFLLKQKSPMKLLGPAINKYRDEGMVGLAESIHMRFMEPSLYEGAHDKIHGHGLRLRGGDFLKQLTINSSNNVSGNILADIRLQPSVLSNTRIAQLAPLWSRWRATNFKVVYVPVENATVTGQILGCIDPDPANVWVSNGGLQNVRNGSAIAGSCAHQVWEGGEYVFAQGKTLTDLYVNPGGSDIRFTDAGSIIIMQASSFSDNTNGNPIGNLYLLYDVEFFVPCLNSESTAYSAQSTELSSSVGVGPTSFFGTASSIRNNSLDMTWFGNTFVTPPSTIGERILIGYTYVGSGLNTLSLANSAWALDYSNQMVDAGANNVRGYQVWRCTAEDYVGLWTMSYSSTTLSSSSLVVSRLTPVPNLAKDMNLHMQLDHLMEEIESIKLKYKQIRDPITHDEENVLVDDQSEASWVGDQPTTTQGEFPLVAAIDDPFIKDMSASQLLGAHKLLQAVAAKNAGSSFSTASKG